MRARPLRWSPQRAAAALALAAALVVTTSARAHFEGAILSSRTASLGGAFVAIADDPSAVVDNPAGLSGLVQPSLLATYQKPFGVDGLDEGFVAVSVPARVLTVGMAWFHRGLDGALSEDRFTLSLARDLKRTSEDASLSIGASVDFARVSAAGSIDENDTAVSFGAGVLLRPFAFIGMGYNIRSINQPSIDLVEGGASTPLARAQAAGLSYYWDNRLTVTAETFEDASSWRTRAGVELRLGPHVMLRCGLESSRASAGVGILWRSVGFDAGFLSHEALGESYVMTFRYARKEPATPYGSTR
ncbi:MAG TPA: hypothetical protein VEC56_01330 [Candidatus Krumholzibacteria bacterium]|nr:hypothetical protein [Candidatus Krumholzibacteria bacterium]